MAKAPATGEKPGPEVQIRSKEQKEALSKRQPALGFAEDGVETIKVAAPPLTDEEMEKLIKTVRELGLHHDTKRFNDAVARVRKRLFARKRTKARSS